MDFADTKPFSIKLVLMISPLLAWDYDISWSLFPDTITLLYACRFLSESGMMILATWLSQAANEEQTSVLLVLLKAYSYFAKLVHCTLYLFNFALDFDD